MWYAIMHETGKVIAEEGSYVEVSESAIKAHPWGGDANGEVAPYYLTTETPRDCDICYGAGKVSDGYELWACRHCEGTGYA